MIKRKEKKDINLASFETLNLHLPEQWGLSSCISYFAYLFCWILLEKSLSLTKQTTLRLCPSAFSPCSTQSYFLYAAVMATLSFCRGQPVPVEGSWVLCLNMNANVLLRAPSGNVHSNITTPTWSHRHLQSLPVGIEEAARVSWQTLHLPFVAIRSQDKCATKGYGVNG